MSQSTAKFKNVFCLCLVGKKIVKKFFDVKLTNFGQFQSQIVAPNQFHQNPTTTVPKKFL